MSNGKSYIPDRLLFSKNSNKVIVIDYKTGKKLDKHKDQILKYAKALTLMGMKNIECFLIYTSEKIKVVKV